MNKRGVTEWILWSIGVMVIMLAAGAILWTRFSTLTDSHAFEVNYYSQDIGLVVDTLNSIPGNQRIDYPIDLSDYTIELNNDSLAVSYGDIKASYYFQKNYFIQIQEKTLVGPKKLIISKFNNKIYLHDTIVTIPS